MKKNYHHGDLKNALIDASIEILKSEGYLSLTLRKVAKKAGVSQSAPYRHFQELEELFAEIATRGFHMLADNLNRVREKYEKYPLIQFRESGIKYVEFAISNSDLFQIMYGNQIENHSKYMELSRAENETYQILKRILQDCMKQNLIKKEPIEKIAMTAWTMVHGVAILIIGKHSMFPKTDLKKARYHTKNMIQYLYRGLK